MTSHGTQCNHSGPGEACPLGATLSPEGVNFSVFSKSATLVELLLFD
jgi:glycogen operon protein